jgi:hypothetical protein
LFSLLLLLFLARKELSASAALLALLAFLPFLFQLRLLLLHGTPPAHARWLH